MELRRTPLFVDNTNIGLWEMKEYLSLADKFGYRVEVVDPQALGPGALDPAVLQSRIGEGAEGRASGKHIPWAVLERMVGNFQSLPPAGTPGDVGEAGTEAATAAADWLQTIRDSKSPWDKPPGPPKPRYAGLDVEAKTFAALGAIDLGPEFWGEQAADGVPLDSNLFDARCKEDGPWQLPDRLHVTVTYFGARPAASALQAAEGLVGTWHEVEARALVFARGGGLLCVDCALAGEGTEALEGLAGTSWLPHVTLLFAKPWQAWESTSLLRAWKQASAKQAPAGAGAAAEAAPNDRDNDNDNEDDVIMLDCDEEATADETGAGVDAEVEAEAEVEGAQLGEDGAEATGPEVQVFPALSVNGREVDVCVLPLKPPVPLGPCKFKMFFA